MDNKLALCVSKDEDFFSIDIPSPVTFIQLLVLHTVAPLTFLISSAGFRNNKHAVHAIKPLLCSRLIIARLINKNSKYY